MILRGKHSRNAFEHYQYLALSLWKLVLATYTDRKNVTDFLYLVLHLARKVTCYFQLFSLVLVLVLRSSIRRANPGTMLLGLLIWPNHFYQCMVSARKYPPFLVSILISDLNQNTVVSQSGPGQSTGKKWWIVPLCTDEPHSRFVTEFCHVEMCAIHYLPKESEFGRPKNKWNILGIICPEFFWSHIFIFLCFAVIGL